MDFYPNGRKKPNCGQKMIVKMETGNSLQLKIENAERIIGEKFQQESDKRISERIENEKSMFLGSTRLSDGVLCLSAKDIFSARQLLQMIDSSVDPFDSKKLTEYLWELALKLRIQASDVQQVLQCDCLPKMSKILNAQICGGSWTKACNGPVYGDINEYCFMNVLFNSIHSASVLHEICRYRSGCVALAQNEALLTIIVKLPFEQIHKLQAAHNLTYHRSFGELEKLSQIP